MDTALALHGARPGRPLATTLSRLLALALFSGICYAQPSVLSPEDAAAGLGEKYRYSEPREPTVLSDTLAPEEIDRAVLNRLMTEIGNDPQSTRRRLGLSEDQLAEVFIILSNARGFINGSEMANVREMCAAWDASAARGRARVEAALAAYRNREQLTRTFIAKYYAVVLFDIESLIDEASRPLLEAYLQDRRGRMARSGASSWGSPVQNIAAGTATIEFHCR